MMILTNGLRKGLTTIFLNNGSIAYQGYNSKFSSKALGYVRIDQKYVNMSESDINFIVTEDSLLKFAEEKENTWML